MSPDETFMAELAAALAAVGLEAVVGGTTAAVLQAAPVMTQDVDLLIRDTGPNREKVRRLAAMLGGRELDLSDLARGMTIVGLAVPVDLLFDALPGGLTFQRLRARARRVEIVEHASRGRPGGRLPENMHRRQHAPTPPGRSVSRMRWPKETAIN